MVSCMSYKLCMKHKTLQNHKIAGPGSFGILCSQCCGQIQQTAGCTFNKLVYTNVVTISHANLSINLFRNCGHQKCNAKTASYA